MNEAQRKFLVERIDGIWRKQTDEIKKELPVKPSLNNYLIAAFLEGSIQFANIDTLKAKMRDSVIKMGKGATLVEEEDEDDDDNWRHRRGRKQNVVKVIAEDLFTIPQNYLDALAEYRKKKAEVEEKISALDAQHDTVTLKIKVGSAKALDKLVDEIDNLTDLKLVNLQLTGNTQKQLE